MYQLTKTYFADQGCSVAYFEMREEGTIGATGAADNVEVRVLTPGTWKLSCDGVQYIDMMLHCFALDNVMGAELTLANPQGRVMQKHAKNVVILPHSEEATEELRSTCPCGNANAWVAAQSRTLTSCASGSV